MTPTEAVPYFTNHPGTPVLGHLCFQCALSAADEAFDIPEGGDLPVSTADLDAGVPSRLLLGWRKPHNSTWELRAKKDWWRSSHGGYSSHCWDSIETHPATVEEGLAWLLFPHSREAK